MKAESHKLQIAKQSILLQLFHLLKINYGPKVGFLDHVINYCINVAKRRPHQSEIKLPA